MSESRASQMLTAAVQFQKKIMAGESASEIERVRKQKEQGAISQEIQDRLEMDEKTERLLEKIRSQAVNPMVQRPKQEQEAEEVPRSFAIAAF